MNIIRLCTWTLGVLLSVDVDAQISQQDDHRIVVTASKQSSRSASANNVSSTIVSAPVVSAPVVSAPELNAAAVTSSDKLVRILPGLNIENSGNLIFSTVSLRGISSAQDFYNPAVTLHVNGVPQLSTNT